MRNKLRNDKEDALSSAETDVLLAGCDDLLDYLTVKLPLFTGLRIGEVQHPRQSWSDWEKGIFTMPARQQCQCRECRKWRKGIWKPKTREGQRSLLITPELEPYLKRLGDDINRTRQELEQRFERIRQ